MSVSLRPVLGPSKGIVMTNGHRLTRRLLTAATLLAIVASGISARAQDDDDEDEAPAPPAPVNAFFMNDAQFDQWVFGNMGAANAATARTKLDSLLTLQVDDLERTCSLTSVQKKKLLLAGRGDIKRFFDRIEDIRKKFSKNRNDQNQFAQVWQEIQPFRNAFNSGFFDGGESIFSKAIKGTLKPEQVEKHEEVVRDRVLYRYWARVDLAMELLNNEVGFTDDQRQQLVKLLREETKPPRRLGEQDYYVVLYQISRIPEAKLKPVFEDFQWRSLKRQVDQGRGMEHFLKQNGFVAGDEPKANATVRKPVEVKVQVRPGFLGR
jgi:hypothetical protein